MIGRQRLGCGIWLSVATETVSAASLLLRLQTVVSLEQNCSQRFFLFLFRGSSSLITKKCLGHGLLMSKRNLLTISLIFCLFHRMSCWKTCLSCEFCRLTPESKSSFHLGGIFTDTVNPTRMRPFLFFSERITHVP